MILPTGMVVRVAIALITVVSTSRQYRTMFNTDRLEAESSRLEDKIRALANHIEEQVAMFNTNRKTKNNTSPNTPN